MQIPRYRVMTNRCKPLILREVIRMHRGRKRRSKGLRVKKRRPVLPVNLRVSLPIYAILLTLR